MGGGSYSYTASVDRSVSLGRATASEDMLFNSTNVQSELDPVDIDVRESRDSEEHPHSVPIIIGLDLTGSMGFVPIQMLRDGFPKIMKGIMDLGIKDPQVMFMGIGDVDYDRYPAQISQFESSDELLDKWLSSLYVREKGGGGNFGESYQLAWYVAARHTETDNFEKRNQKGFIFTIGDEPVTDMLAAHKMRSLFSKGSFQGDINTTDILKEAQEKWNVYHIHTTETPSGRISSATKYWDRLLGDNLLTVQSHTVIPELIASTIALDIAETYPGEWVDEATGEQLSVVDEKGEDSKEEATEQML